MNWLVQYLVAAVAFAAVDFVWLTRIGKQLYDDQIGHLLAASPNKVAAVAFYAIFLAGLVFFVIHPAIEQGSWSYALFVGAFFGLVTYATFDLTNLAVLKGFPVSIAIIDIAWGIFLASSVSTLTYFIVTKIT
jgi:uncharacterized membrane protein